ncbi:hypothetical protein EYF80_014700 [Liparis tanakae]|uniref:Uncharacterized protein n=1 Tax=Liparis tanakae TaxID=230148 RepID=A0A4Z2IAZ5_9TELE|nr:hypothetical protein EYF80_014700 [Liparis tanakae]
MEAALRRGDLPLLPPSGFSIHHELFPVPSFWTRIKRLCSDRLCLMEFCREREKEGGRFSYLHKKRSEVGQTDAGTLSEVLTLSELLGCQIAD